MTGKNLQLLGLADSPARQRSITELLRDLATEIAKGEAVYTLDELRILERKLADYQALARSMFDTH
ncbi:MAG TPA: hypothetical protein VIU41_13275 [Geobacteraceae bacterium]